MIEKMFGCTIISKLRSILLMEVVGEPPRSGGCLFNHTYYYKIRVSPIRLN